MFLRFKGEQEKRREREREREKGKRRDQKECNSKWKSNEKNGREMRTGEMQKSGKEKMVLVFIFPLVLIFLFSCSFPLEKTKGNNNEHVSKPS